MWVHWFCEFLIRYEKDGEGSQLEQVDVCTCPALSPALNPKPSTLKSYTKTLNRNPGGDYWESGCIWTMEWVLWERWCTLPIRTHHSDLERICIWKSISGRLHLLFGCRYLLRVFCAGMVVENVLKWELSKEKVQPLRKGRSDGTSMWILTRSLFPDCTLPKGFFSISVTICSPNFSMTCSSSQTWTKPKQYLNVFAENGGLTLCRRYVIQWLQLLLQRHIIANDEHPQRRSTSRKSTNLSRRMRMPSRTRPGGSPRGVGFHCWAAAAYGYAHTSQ